MHICTYMCMTSVVDVYRYMCISVLMCMYVGPLGSVPVSSISNLSNTDIGWCVHIVSAFASRLGSRTRVSVHFGGALESDRGSRRINSKPETLHQRPSSELWGTYNREACVLGWERRREARSWSACSRLLDAMLTEFPLLLTGEGDRRGGLDSTHHFGRGHTAA